MNCLRIEFFNTQISLKKIQAKKNQWSKYYVVFKEKELLKKLINIYTKWEMIYLK
jgi:hypothetical protein